MPDVVDRPTRSRMMSGIRGKNTKPEILVRSLLHRRGFRFRLHDRKLPGKPDIVLPRYRAVILIHGCFWHGHDCHLFKWPSSNESFWKEKISRNKEVDKLAVAGLIALGWRVLTVWECSLKGKMRNTPELLADEISTWLMTDGMSLEIKGGICNSQP